MTETAARAITQFVAGLVRRKRWLAVKDRLILSAILVGLLVAAVIGIYRLFPAAPNLTIVIYAVLAAAVSVLIYTGWRAVGLEVETVASADVTLSLDERLVSAYQIVKAGSDLKHSTLSNMQVAVVEDAARRVEGVRAAAMLPNRLKKWYAVAPLALAALIVMLNLPSVSLPAVSEAEKAKDDVARAGEQLEQGSEEIQKLVPVTTTTARLAQEQAEIGASFRTSPGPPVEALKRLSEVADKIRQRHSELEQTKADEIVAIADSRLQPALSRAAQEGARISNRDKTPEPAAGADDKAGNLSTKDRDRPEARNKEAGNKEAGNKRTSNSESTPPPGSNQGNNDRNQTAEKKPSESSGDDSAANPKTPTSPAGQPKETAGIPERNAPRGQNANNNANNPDREGSRETKSIAPKSTEAGSPAAPPETPTSEADKASEKQPGEPQQPTEGLPKNLPSIPPGLSEQLMKRALEMKSGQLDEKDLKNLVQAAKFLSKDLERLAQSKELRDALEQMAKKVSPEQLEQVARELSKQEGLKQELEAAARLLEQNQEAREIVAGLAETVEPFRNQLRSNRNANSPAGPQKRNRADGPAGDGGQSGDPRGKDARGASGETLEPLDLRAQLDNKGRTVKPGGKLGKGDGGQQLFLQEKAGTGPARVPYSNAYPKYRRDAERRVTRSQVPPTMRSMVRDYFDAINPNDKD